MNRKCLGSIAGLLAVVGTVAAQAPTPVETVPPGTIMTTRYEQPAPVVPAPVASSSSLAPASCGDNYVAAPRFWVSAEYLAWWLKKEQSHATVIFGISPTSLATEAELPAGAISRLGNDPARADYGEQNGVRVTVGFSLDTAGDWG